EYRAGRQQWDGAGSGLVALAMVEATVVANRGAASSAPFLAVSLVALAAVGAGCGREPKVVAPPPPDVSVSQPVEEPVQETLEFTGRVSAVQSVEVRARVTGYITKVAFTDGQLVNAGDLLFAIDPREYQAAVLRAEGEVARLRAQLARTESEVARNRALRPSGAASARELERAVAEKGAAEGELKAKLAQLDLARLDLEFTRVTAPIAGRVSRAEITPGNLVVVGASGGPLLTTVVKLGPLQNALRAVTDGLAPGEWVIVNGIQRARPGGPVTPQKVSMRPGPPAEAPS